jgi:hypothetical protein
MSKPDPLLEELAKALARSAAAGNIANPSRKSKPDENRTLRSLQQRVAK